MKIGIITIHNIHNFGSVLQAWALNEYLINRGYDCKVINYNPWYLSHTGIKSEIGKILNFWNFVSRKRKYDEFVKKQIRLTKKNYKNEKQLIKFPPKVDLFLAGGDQLWNEYYPCGQDKVFQLSFTQKPKISYGTSMGKSTFSEEGMKKLKTNLISFEAIGVRESSGVDLLQQMGLTAKNVCDPVFLIQPKSYLPFISRPKVEDKYLLVYLVPASPVLNEAIQMIASKLNLKVVMNTGFIAKGDYDYQLKNVGPDESLSYLYYADYILSGSFHATAFSLMFHKPFLTILPGENTNARIENLMTLVGLENRTVSNSQQLGENVFKSIDWDKVENRMQMHISESKQFLDKALDDCRKKYSL